ncbi:hypothetical protein Daus18300_012826 [Diaporthe australafricana]|uniref:Uncharacterized protein n=1 Tax=Diaporthe australafricana TaxID=127596 RepID=A0ABR3W1L9_9PEZI
MSDHILKNDQAKIGHTGTTGIKLKPVTDAAELILEHAKTAIANTGGSDNVPDTGGEMDLTFYDTKGNVETADPDGDTSTEDESNFAQSDGEDADVESDGEEFVAVFDPEVRDADEIRGRRRHHREHSVSLPVEGNAEWASMKQRLVYAMGRGHRFYPADNAEGFAYDKYRWREKRFRVKYKDLSQEANSERPKGGKSGYLKDGTRVVFDAESFTPGRDKNVVLDISEPEPERPSRPSFTGKTGAKLNGDRVSYGCKGPITKFLDEKGNVGHASGKREEDEEIEVDDKLEEIVRIDVGKAEEEVARLTLRRGTWTRMAFGAERQNTYDCGHGMHSQTRLKLRRELYSLGIYNFRPIDVAWNYVWKYNEEILKLWRECNKDDPYEKDRVMRQIDDLNNKRCQRLAEAGQEQDCPVECLTSQGWVKPELRKPLPPLEPEVVKQPEAVEKAKVVEKPEEVVGPRVESQFEAQYEALASSKSYESDLPDLATYEASLFKRPAIDAATECQVESGDSTRGHHSLFSDSEDDDQPDPTPAFCDTTDKVSEIAADASVVTHQVSTEEDAVGNNHGSLFSDSKDADQSEPAPASCNATEEPKISENTINPGFITQQVSHEMKVVQNGINVDLSFSGGEVEGMDLDTGFNPSQVAYELQSGSNAGINANISPGHPADGQDSEHLVDEIVPSRDVTTPQPALSLTEKMPVVADGLNFNVAGVNDPSLSIQDDQIFRGMLAEPEGMTGISPFTNIGDEYGETFHQRFEAPPSELTFDSFMGSGNDDPAPVLDLPPNEQFDAPPDQGSEVLPDQGLGADPQIVEQLAPEKQATPDAAVVEQITVPPQEGQIVADQSKATGDEEIQDIQQPADTEVFRSKAEWNPYPERPTFEEFFPKIEPQGQVYLARLAFEKLDPFVFNHDFGPQKSFWMFASGSAEFQEEELQKYKSEFDAGRQYVVQFAEEGNEIPPHQKAVAISNGWAMFNCLVAQEPAQEPAQDAMQAKPSAVIDLTGDATPSPTVAAPSGAPMAVLAPPAEITAASEPVTTTANGASNVKGPATPEQPPVVGNKKAARFNKKNVPEIAIPTFMDEATFSDISASPISNAEPATSAQGDADGNDGSSSNNTLSKTQTPLSPLTPPQRIQMEYYTTSDGSVRRHAAAAETAGATAAAAAAEAEAAELARRSVQASHNALNTQLRTPQSAARVQAPPVQNAPAVGAESDASPAQQHGATQEPQPSEYFGASPSRTLGLDTPSAEWAAQAAQGAKGQKRKTPTPKETRPRKARKTAQSTAAPAAEQSSSRGGTPGGTRSRYVHIAPKPEGYQSQDGASAVHMKHPVSTPVRHGGASGALPNAQANGNRPQMHPPPSYVQNNQSHAAPQMSQNGYQDSVQPMDQQSFQVGFQRGLQAQMPQNSYRHSVQPINKQSFQGGSHGGLQDPMGQKVGSGNLAEQPRACQPPNDAADCERRMELLERRCEWLQSQQQQRRAPQPQHIPSDRERRMDSLERRYEFLESQEQDLQHQMASPQMMLYQHMPAPGIPRYSMNMHQGYQQGFPSVGYPPSMNSSRNGTQMLMDYSHGYRPTSFQAVDGYGYSYGGAEGDYADEGNMMN